MSTTQPVHFERKQDLAVVTLANPDFNRLNRAVLSGLQRALQHIRQPGVRAVLLKADGPVFSYGADVKDFSWICPLRNSRQCCRAMSN